MKGEEENWIEASEAIYDLTGSNIYTKKIWRLRIMLVFGLLAECMLAKIIFSLVPFLLVLKLMLAHVFLYFIFARQRAIEWPFAMLYRLALVMVLYLFHTHILLTSFYLMMFIFFPNGCSPVLILPFLLASVGLKNTLAFYQAYDTSVCMYNLPTIAAVISDPFYIHLGDARNGMMDCLVKEGNESFTSRCSTGKYRAVLMPLDINFPVLFSRIWPQFLPFIGQQRVQFWIEKFLASYKVSKNRSQATEEANEATNAEFTITKYSMPRSIPPLESAQDMHNAVQAARPEMQLKGGISYTFGDLSNRSIQNINTMLSGYIPGNENFSAECEALKKYEEENNLRKFRETLNTIKKKVDEKAYHNADKVIISSSCPEIYDEYNAQYAKDRFGLQDEDKEECGTKKNLCTFSEGYTLYQIWRLLAGQNGKFKLTMPPAFASESMRGQKYSSLTPEDQGAFSACCTDAFTAPTSRSFYSV
jgi:hypothetical protein